jgi:hypothetical protein
MQKKTRRSQKGHKSPIRRMSKQQKEAHVSRSKCAILPKNKCDANPNCRLTKNKKTPCRARKGVRSFKSVYQGPLME